MQLDEETDLALQVAIRRMLEAKEAKRRVLVEELRQSATSERVSSLEDRPSLSRETGATPRNCA